MRILFVVCGEGLGHSSRCIHLGHYLEQHGHSVSYLAYGKSYDFFHDHGCVTVFLGQREVCLEGENGFFSLKKTLWCSRWIALNMIRSALRVRRLIREQRIDCVVCDTMYGGVLAARVRNVPVVFITNQNRFSGPGGRKNPVWETLNFLIRRYLRLADTVIIPDYPPPETVSEYNLLIPERERQHYHFTGPFLDVDLSRYHFGQKTIFTSFGGEPYSSRSTGCFGRLPMRERISFLMYSIPVPSFPNPPTIICPMGMCPTSMNISPRRGSLSSMAD